MQTITAVCFGCTICASKVFMQKLPHHIPHLSLQWFRPHPEVPCVATNFVGLILMFFRCESKPAARTSGTACNIELQSNKKQPKFLEDCVTQHAQRDCHHLFRKVSGIFPELARNFSGTSPEFPELPRNFRNSPGISGTLGSARISRPNQFPNPLSELARNFRNFPGISGTFPELSRNFPGFSRNFPGTFPELSRNFAGTFPGPFPETPEDLLGFLPNSFKNVTRAEPTQIFCLMPGRREKEGFA